MLKVKAAFLFLTFSLPVYAAKRPAFCGFSIDEQTNKIQRWRRADFPIPFYIHKSVPFPAHYAFLDSIKCWNHHWKTYLEKKNIEPFALFSAPRSGRQYHGLKEYDGYNMLFFMHDEEKQKHKKLGKLPSIDRLASEHSRSLDGRILESDILANSEIKGHRYFYDTTCMDSFKSAQNRRPYQKPEKPFFRFVKNWTSYIFNFFPKQKAVRQIAGRFNTPDNMVNFSYIMLHELGHALGLDHSPEGVDSIMAARGLNDISEYDLSNLYCGYFLVKEEEIKTFGKFVSSPLPAAADGHPPGLIKKRRVPESKNRGPSVAAPREARSVPPRPLRNLEHPPGLIEKRRVPER